MNWERCHDPWSWHLFHLTNVITFVRILIEIREGKKRPQNQIAVNKLKNQKYLVLLLLIWGGMVIDPLLENHFLQKTLFSVFQSAVVLFSFWVFDFSKKARLAALVFGIVAILTSWYIRFFSFDFSFRIINVIAYSFFFCIVIFHIILELATGKKVGMEDIFEAIIAYLALGLLGASIAAMVETVQPGAYNFEHAQTVVSFDVFTYYSFTTLTTLGYGDITPVAPAAKALAITLSLIGQIYLTIVIAMLVGKYIKFNE